MKLIVFFLCSCNFILTGCSSQKAVEEDCGKLYENYQDHIMKARYDSADYYLTKAFHCDTSNLQYGVELYSLKIQIANKKEALNVLGKLRKMNSALEFSVAEELLIYQLDGVLDTNALEGYFKEYRLRIAQGSASESDVFCFVALSNFLEGKQQALQQLHNYLGQVDKTTGRLSAIREMIEKRDSLEVVKEIFNVE